MRNPERHTQSGVSQERAKQAIDYVLAGHNCYSAAKKFNICNSTMKRIYDKYKKTNNYPTMGWNVSKAVFSGENEQILCDSIAMANIKYKEIPSKLIRTLAFDIAKACHLNYPSNWERDGMAGQDWFGNFKAKHPKLFAKSKFHDNMCSISENSIPTLKIERINNKYVIKDSKPLNEDYETQIVKSDQISSKGRISKVPKRFLEGI